MVQTSFDVDNAGSLTGVLQDVSIGGSLAAADTDYTITLTAAVSLLSPPTPAASLDLPVGSSVTLEGTVPLIVDSFAVTGSVAMEVDFTGTVTLDGGVLDNIATASAGGVTTAGLYHGAVLGISGDPGDTAVNDGVIQYNGLYAAIEFDTGTIQNGWDGTSAAEVSNAAAGGVQLTSSGLVQNGGTIMSSSDTSVAVYVGEGTIDNGQIGDTGALISGGLDGAEIAGAGVLANDGTIIGVRSDGVYLGSGSVTNGQDGDTTALIQGGTDDGGVWIGAAGTLGNFGTILAGGASGVYISGAGLVTNGSVSDTAALIAGPYEGVLIAGAGTLLNDGTVLATGSLTAQDAIGAFLESGGTIENLSSAAAIDGVQWGAIVEGAAGTVVNQGSIQAADPSGLGVDLTAGGTVVNGTAPGSTATIAGGFDGVRIAAGTAGAGAFVDNEGTISGSVGVDFLSGAAIAVGTLVNNGLIESTEGVVGYAVEFGTGAETLVLQSGGSFIGSVLGSDQSGSSTTLELAAGTSGTLSNLGADNGTVTDAAGSFVFDTIGTLAIDIGASWTLAAPAVPDSFDIAGTLDITGTDVLGTGVLQLQQGGELADNAGSIAASQTVAFTGANQVLTLGSSAIAGFDALIQGFGSGDTIRLNDVPGFTDSLDAAGTQLTLFSNGVSIGVLDFAAPITAQDVQQVQCFAAGTRIRTRTGDLPVEQLQVGDAVWSVLTASWEPIAWIGSRQVDCRRHPRPETVRPVRVRAGAFGPGAPVRDLVLSPDHAVLVNAVLIPVKLLVNGTSILPAAQEQVHYLHIELDRHGVVLAEGLTVETYLDIGNRSNFANASLVALHPDFVGDIWEMAGCARLVLTGADLTAARRVVAAHAEAMEAAAAPSRRRA